MHFYSGGIKTEKEIYGRSNAHCGKDSQKPPGFCGEALADPADWRLGAPAEKLNECAAHITQDNQLQSDTDTVRIKKKQINCATN